MKRNTIIQGFLLSILPASCAFAAVNQPSCEAIASYARQTDLKATAPVGDSHSGLELGVAVQSPAFAKLFGAPALTWTLDDVKASASTINECAAAFGKAKDRDSARAVGYFGRQVQQIGVVLTRIARAQDGFDKTFKALLDAPPNRDQLAALMILDRARDGASAADAARAYAKQITDNNDSKQIHGQAAAALNQLLATLMRAPKDMGDRMYPALTERREALIQSVTKDEIARIDAVPLTLQGLQSLQGLRQDIDKDVRLVLPPPAYQQVVDAFDNRRSGIQKSVQAEVVAQIGKAPMNGGGLGMLDQIGNSPVLAMLPPDGVKAIRMQIASRRSAILDGMVQGSIDRLGQFPQTLDGLTQLVSYANNTTPAMTQVAGADRSKRFADAVHARAEAIGTAALPTFTKALDALSEDRPGLLSVNSMEKQVTDVATVMPAALADQYANALKARKARITAAVQDVDAKAEALPLVGATYVSIAGKPSIAFRNADHAYVAVSEDTTLDVTYEVDGKKIILHGLPAGNVVLERQGDMLVGAGLHMKRKSG